MKNWIQCFSVIFVMAMTVLFSGNDALAQERTDFNIQDGNLTKYAGTTPNVEIPDDVVTIGSGVFKKHTEITSVTIPDGVTVIESEAFSGCKSLQNITFPSALVSIEKEAFKDCSNLDSISIPGNVTNIGSRAFQNCKKVSNINISNGVQTIGSYAFYNNGYVTSVVIPDSVTSLGSSAFASCDYLQDITFSKSLAAIPTSVIEGCNKIKKIRIPDGVQILENRCFADCSGLTYLAIPDSVTSISKLGLSSNTLKKLRIYCNTGTAAYDYAVEKNVFYVPLANYESESAGGSTDDSTGNPGDSTGNTNTGNNSGDSTGNVTTTPDTSADTPVQPEKSISSVECINRKCVRVSFTDGTGGVYDVPQMTPETNNNITITEGGKQYSYKVKCPAFKLTIESIQAISANQIQMKYSGDFVLDKNGSQCDPDFVISGFADMGGLETSFDQVNKILVLKLPAATKQDTLYTVQAKNYDVGVVIFNQSSFYGFEPVVITPEPDISNDPTIWNPIEDNNTGSNSSNDSNMPDNSNSSNTDISTDTNTSNNNTGNNSSSGSGWNDDYNDYEEEEPEYDPPRLSVKKKTIKRKKSFILRVRNASSSAKWKTKNKRIAKINKTRGYSIKVKGLKKGTTYITARVDGYTLKCKVKVK